MRAVRAGNERGAVAIIVAILIVVLCGFMALSLNVGHLMSVRGELQNAADAGALAGGWDLDGTAEGVAAAKANAMSWATRHDTDILPVAPEATKVEVGHWNADARVFTAVNDLSPEGLSVTNAIWVRTAREEASANAVPVFFAGTLGNSGKADVAAEAVVVRGGPCVERCGLPLAFASCQILDANDNVLCAQNKIIYFSNDSGDNIGFTSLSDVVSSNTDVVTQILQGILNPGTGAYNCSLMRKGQPINISNGDNITPDVASLFDQIRLAHPDAVYSVPVIEANNCATADPKFNQTPVIKGFASVEILCAGQLETCSPDLIPPGASDTALKRRVVIFKIHCGEPSQYTAGCDMFGPLADPRLVR